MLVTSGNNLPISENAKRERFKHNLPSNKNEVPILFFSVDNNLPFPFVSSPLLRNNQDTTELTSNQESAISHLELVLERDTQYYWFISNNSKQRISLFKLITTYYYFLQFTSKYWEGYFFKFIYNQCLVCPYMCVYANRWRKITGCNFANVLNTINLCGFKVIGKGRTYYGNISGKFQYNSILPDILYSRKFQLINRSSSFLVQWFKSFLDDR